MSAPRRRLIAFVVGVNVFMAGSVVRFLSSPIHVAAVTTVWLAAWLATWPLLREEWRSTREPERRP